MAKKRLNKKVALIGSAVFALLLMVAIVWVLYVSRDPDKFIGDAEIAARTARETSDPNERENAINTAIRFYGKAYGRIKTDPEKVEILFKLADLHLLVEDWRNALGCWVAITDIQSDDVAARFARLKYYETLADSYSQTGAIAPTLWKQIAEQTNEFIELAEKMDLMEEETD